MIPIFIDFETYWSATHSLSKMNPVAYVTHPDTEIISMAMKVGTAGETKVYFGAQAITDALRSAPTHDAMLIGHNMSGFDSMILAWRFGITPKMWGCTLAMARPLHALDVGGSLSKLVAHYKLGVKNQEVLFTTRGKRLADFTKEELDAMAQYNIADTDQCAQLFSIFRRTTSNDELLLIDMTTRMLVEPRFIVDSLLLNITLAEEQVRKMDALMRVAEILNITVPSGDLIALAEEVRAQLASSHKFASLLESLGVDPPLKPSPTNPEKTTYALAKSDEAFIALTEHDDPAVAAAASARLDVKSTILESRIHSFLEVSEATGGKMPVFLNYYAAHTGRWGGGGGLNQQNLPRIPRDKEGNIVHKPTNALRMCLRAPAGQKVIVADLSGIELRVNHFLWKEPNSMALFNLDPEKADLYKEFASNLYNTPISEVTKAQRQVGKVAHLGLGFGAGGATFARVAKLMAGIDMPLDEATEVVQKWRENYPKIVAGWKRCHAALEKVYDGNEFAIDPWGLCVVEKDYIRTPKGVIRYPGLHLEEKEDGKTEWVYGEGRNKTRIYAGKVDENLVQHLARSVIADAAIEFYRKTGLTPALTVHDELVYVVEERRASDLLAELQNIMRTPPAWWPELVTWSEGDVADSYGEAK